MQNADFFGDPPVVWSSNIATPPKVPTVLPQKLLASKRHRDDANEESHENSLVKKLRDSMAKFALDAENSKTS